MTDKLAIYLGLLIVAALAVDFYVQGWDGLIFLMGKLGNLTEWMAFWR